MFGDYQIDWSTFGTPYKALINTLLTKKDGKTRKPSKHLRRNSKNVKTSMLDKQEDPCCQLDDRVDYERTRDYENEKTSVCEIHREHESTPTIDPRRYDTTPVILCRSSRNSTRRNKDKMTNPLTEKSCKDMVVVDSIDVHTPQKSPAAKTRVPPSPPSSPPPPPHPPPKSPPPSMPPPIPPILLEMPEVLAFLTDPTISKTPTLPPPPPSTPPPSTPVQTPESTSPRLSVTDNTLTVPVRSTTSQPPTPRSTRSRTNSRPTTYPPLSPKVATRKSLTTPTLHPRYPAPAPPPPKTQPPAPPLPLSPPPPSRPPLLPPPEPPRTPTMTMSMPSVYLSSLPRSMEQLTVSVRN